MGPNRLTVLLCPRITVDLTTDRSDIAFHFNPRFNENGNKVIVRNSCVNQTWGAEERQLDTFPFVPGMPFEVRHFPLHHQRDPSERRG